MLTSIERRKLEAQYCQPIDARAVLAKCAAGLFVIAGIAALGVVASADEQSVKAAVTGSQVATGR